MKRLLVALGIMLLAGGCDKKQPVECTAESASAPVIDIVKEQLEKTVSTKVRGDDGARQVGLSKIRAAIAQLVIAIEDVRTSKQDPNSTKRFCTGTLRIKFPSDTLDDADKTREAAGLHSISDLADDSDVERHADAFTSSIDFNVQPTDDGSKVFAETESGNNMFAFAAEVIASGLLRSAVEDTQREAKLAQDQQQAARDSAMSEQRSAAQNSAKVDNQIATQTIAAAWKAIPEEIRAQLLPQQRAWIRKKDADCLVEAAAASTDPTEVETARLTCDTRITQERTNQLAPYRAQEPDGAPQDEM